MIFRRKVIKNRTDIAAMFLLNFFEPHKKYRTTVEISLIREQDSLSHVHR